MGYESKFYIGYKSRRPDTVDNAEKKYSYFTIIASFDMCRMSNDFFTKVLNDAKVSNCYGYFNDDNVPVTTDLYGDEFKEISIEKMIAFLKQDESRNHYRRIPPFLSLLESFNKSKSEWNELTVLHYGY